MNPDYTILMTEKDPFVYLEHAKLHVKDDKLTVYHENGTIELIPVLTTLVIMLGAGTSITQAAAIFCAQNNLYLTFARGGSYIHSVWQGGRWASPEGIVKQAHLHKDQKERLRIAKKIIELKIKKEVDNHDFMQELSQITTITKLLSFEAHQAKRTYKQLAEKHKVENFTRDQESKEGVNSRITLLNNALYSFCTAVILLYGFHPSIGFVHGQTRRGGLAFDLADIFKYQLCLEPSFKENRMSDKDMVTTFSIALRKNNLRILKEMILVMRYIEGEASESEVEEILDEHSRI